MEDYDPRSKERYFSGLEKVTKDIRKKFLDLTWDIFTSLEKRDVPVSKVASFFHSFICHHYDHTDMHLYRDLMSCSSVHRIHDIILQLELISFCNFEILESLIEKLGSSDDKSKMADYNKCFKDFVFTMFHNRVKCGTHICNQNKVAFKLEHSLNDERASKRKEGESQLAEEQTPLTGEVIKETKEKIASIIGTDSCDLFLCCIRTGCLEFEFSLSDTLHKVISTLSAESKMKLFRKNIPFMQISGCRPSKVAS